jgi:hypothetical protein
MWLQQVETINVTLPDARRGLIVTAGAREQAKMRLSRRVLILGGGFLWLRAGATTRSRTYPVVPGQPFFASLARVREALERFGSPLPETLVRRLQDLERVASDSATVEAQALLEPWTLLHLELLGDRGAHMELGQARPDLPEQGSRLFLVRVLNPDARREPLQFRSDSPVLGDVQRSSRSPRWAHERQGEQTPERAIDVVTRAALKIESFTRPPLLEALSGLGVEYRLLQVTAFRAGVIETTLRATASVAAPDWFWGPSRRTQLRFNAVPSRTVSLQLRGHDNRGLTAAITIRDSVGRTYPDKAGRLAPDMYFQDQVYRADGETVRLPDGAYVLEVKRGPEYLAETVPFVVGPGATEAPPVRLQRWVDPAARGWYSGDPHIHAAGCAHYNDPSIGVGPETMIRHVRGEGLWIGEVLTWGPGYDVQRRNFTGGVAVIGTALEQPDLQVAHGNPFAPRASATDADSLLRYDLETAGFPSSGSGHLILMNLADQDYPGTRRPPDWPSWSLPILRWAKAQGATTGFAHCGLGLATGSLEIPGLQIPAFDGIGANEYLVDVAHGLVDFLAGGSTVPQAELTLWYHALNCGFRTAFLGETDWPCLTDDRVGYARTYAGLDEAPRGEAGYRAWIDAIGRGRCYMGDGRAHVFELRLGRAGIGEELRIARPGRLRLRATLVARLPEDASASAHIRAQPPFDAPRWHLERARLGSSRSVPVEVIVNGKVAHVQRIVADGSEQRIDVELAISRSSWVALRILPALHTQPVFVLVRGRPVRASADSARWCLESLDVLERDQLPRINPKERAEAAAAYSFARASFERVRQECEA